MIKHLVIFLMCTSFVFGATKWVVGGAGTGADKSTNNGGGYLIGGTATWNTFQATNAGPTDTITAEAVDITDNGTSDVRITDFAAAGDMTENMVVGQLQNIDFSGTVNYTSGRYTIIAVINSDTWDIDATYIADDLNKDITVYSGGALPNPGDVPDSDDIAVGVVLGPGDKVWVRAIADYTTTDESDSILFFNQVGTTSAPVVWESHFVEISSETGDGGLAKLDATSTRANALKSGFSGGAGYHVFKNFIFTRGSGSGAEMGTDDFVVFKNCSSVNNGGDGFNGGNDITLESCLATQNVIGFDLGGGVTVINSVVHGNSGKGIDTSNGVIYNTLVYDNGDTSQIFFNSTDTMIVIGCTIDGENDASSVGIFNTNANVYGGVIANCVFFDLNIGIDTDGGGTELVTDRHNVFNSVNTPVSDWLSPSTDATPNLRGSYTSAADPFVASGGSPRDYDVTDAVKETGIDATWAELFFADGDEPPNDQTSYMDPGAKQKQITGGGGGTFPRFIERHGD